MPPEPVPWDRRDFRKHDRSDPRFGGAGNFGGGGGPQRWRDQNHHAPPPHPSPYHHQRTPQRWYNNDFRSSSRPVTPRPVTPGHGKQGGWHMYPDDAGHGYLPYGSRYGDRNFEEDSPRPFTSRSDGRYFRNTRENRGSFGQKEWKAPHWEAAASPSGPGRPSAEVANMRSVENTQTPQNNSTKIIESSPLNRVNQSAQPQSQPVLKEQQGKDDATATRPGSTSQRVEKENGLGHIDWNTLKWSRSGSLSSRGSGLTHSSSSKSMGAESKETVAEVQTQNPTPLESPAAEATTCVSLDAPAPSGEATSRKKPRLGWGEGLAKFEKKKVDGPEDYAMSNGLAVSINNGEISHSHPINLADKSPRVVLLSDCASPSTPSSVACSSSPGSEEKESIKSVNLNNDGTKLSCSPSVELHDQYDGPAFNLENFDLSSIANLSSLINQMVQSYDSSTTDTVYVQTSSMNKLVVWKDNVTKALVVTESEIDSLETELKSLIVKPSSSPRPASSSSIPADGHLAPCEDQSVPIKDSCRPPPLQVVSSGEVVTDNKQVATQEVLKDEDFDSPGSATSKFVEAAHGREDILHSGTADGVQGSVDLDANNCSSLSLKFTDNGIGHKNYCNVELDMIDRSQEWSAGSTGRLDVNDHESIWANNKDCANRAVEKLYKKSPFKMQFDVMAMSSVSSVNKDPSMVKKKFLTRKRLLQFKEKVLSLKYKVFRHFWKENRVLSVRKLRLKSHKKFDLAGHKKNRASSRPRTSLSSGSSQTVPSDEVIEFVNNLLSEVPSKPCRSSLKMPALILDKKERKLSRFISDNSLIVDPCAVEKERSMINPWSTEETEMFIDKLVAFGKDFVKISSFLDNKTTADCVEFYYKNHKSVLFERARKKKPDTMKQWKPQSTTYMVASTKRWNRGMNAASLDMLGAASAIAATVEGGTEVLKKCTSRFSSAPPSSKSEDGPLQRVNSLDTYTNEREVVAADVLAGICGTISSEAMSSCITSSVDPGDGCQEWRYQRVGSYVKRPVTPEVTQSIDDECSDESCGEMDPTDWTDEEKSVFIQAVSSYGKDFVLISQALRTRTKDQCRLYYSKARKCLGLDTIQREYRGADSGDVNGGGSDVEDACDVEAGSGICNEGSGSKMEEDLPPCDGKLDLISDLKPEFMIENHQKNGLSNSDCTAAGPVTEVSPPVHSQMDGKLVAHLSVDDKEPMQELGTMDMSSNTYTISPDVLSEAEKRASIGVTEGQTKEESEGQHASSPDENSNERIDELNANSGESALSCTVNELKSDPCVSHPSIDSNSSLQIEEVTESRKEVCPETLSVEKSHLLPLEENGQLDSTLFSVPIKYQRSPPHSSLSASGCSRNYNNHSQNIALSDPVESLQILRGYPVSVQTKKQINCDVNYKRSVPLQNVPKQDGVLHSDRFSLKKCSAPPVHLSSIPEIHFASKEPSKDHSRPQSSGSSDVDRHPRNGDVKLFGKILTSAQPKSSSVEQDDNVHKPSVVVQSLNLRLNGDCKVNSDTAQSKLDSSNFMGAENVPVRNCGFWDGNRIQTSFSQLPDSALLLSKYPAAFSNYSMHAMKLDPPSASSVSMFASNNGVENYPVLRNREVQPFTIDMQRRMGFDMISGMQQQSRGMHVVGGRGVLSNGVSDPVAAIKMHYANASEQFNLQNGNILKEDETWRSNGDLGR